MFSDLLDSNSYTRFYTRKDKHEATKHAYIGLSGDEGYKTVKGGKMQATIRKAQGAQVHLLGGPVCPLGSSQAVSMKGRYFNLRKPRRTSAKGFFQYPIGHG